MPKLIYEQGSKLQERPGLAGMMELLLTMNYLTGPFQDEHGRGASIWEVALMWHPEEVGVAESD
jgi:hypothetical protein